MLALAGKDRLDASSAMTDSRRHSGQQPAGQHGKQRVHAFGACG